MKKIKILYTISHLFYGGVEVSLYDLCRFIHKNDFEIVILSLLQGTALEDKFESLEGVKLVKLNIKNKYNPLIIPKIIYHIYKEKPDIIHSNLTVADIYTRLSSLFFSIKTISSARNPLIRDTFLYKVDRWTSKINTKLIANTQWMKKHILKLGYSAENRINIIHSGIDFSKFSKANETQSKEDFLHKYHIPQDAVIMSYVASFNPMKAHIYLFYLVKKLLDDKKQVYLILIGLGNSPINRKMFDYFKALCEKWKINQNVIFVGELHNPRDVLEHTDIYISSSLAESQGRAILEAMYLKKPVIAFDVDAVREIIIEDKTGFPVTLHNEKAKYDTINSMYDFDFNIDQIDVDNLYRRTIEVIDLISQSDSKLIEIIENAHKLAVDEYSIEIITAQHEELYKEMVNEKN
ncbi:MAG: glycosyltransferase family 4 protein [Candidatus Cloacimonetes bacterium]|nr:glycosyltransferase family 4 protein [Candidatus Cloacimonadota bacterium]